YTAAMPAELLQRLIAPYENLSSDYVIPAGNRNYRLQYSHVYSQRLHSMRAQLEALARERWPSLPLRRISEIVTGERCIVVGTLFKDMPLKPSILSEIGEDQQVEPPPVPECCVSDKDRLILEDDLQRIQLVGDIAKERLVTGIVLAVLGKEPDEARGRFQVEEHLFAQPAPQPQWLPLEPEPEQDIWLAVVSGLHLGDPAEDVLRLRLLVQRLTCSLIPSDSMRQSAASVVRLLIAGNSLAKSTQDQESHSRALYLSKKAAVTSAAGVSRLDSLVSELAASIPVDLMPGEFDPSGYFLPQQPLHHCMLPQSGRYSSLNLVTNPYRFRLADWHILATSGQTVKDVKKFSNIRDPLDLMEGTLRWRHLAPTAPDTLGCFPFYESDPLLLDFSPHLYIAGNQASFGHRLVKDAAGQETLLVSVPAFADTGECALVGLRSRRVRRLLLSAEGFHGAGRRADAEVPMDTD
ncbi:hypothetical protein BOX15_Mlig013796g2, partial [Macrostomum lignano]